jgi:AraC-like DNA-binding protein
MLRSEKLSVYRFNHELPPCLPLAVRSAGVYSLVDDALVEPPVRKWFSEVFWSEEGAGEFILEKRPIRVAEFSVFYLLPGEVHELRPLSARWKYHWFTLDHPMSPQWLEAFGFVSRPLRASHCPTAMFEALREALSEGTMEGDRRASHHAHAILLSALEGSLAPFAKSHSSWVEDCRKQLDERYADPRLNINTIAHEIGLHRSTLFRAFLAAYGMTPSHYLQNLRLHHAMELLKQTELPIKEVAARSGLANANYLGRLIRRLSGTSPRHFRSTYRVRRMDHS